MIALDSLISFLIVFSRSSPGTGPFIIQNLGPSHPPAKRTPENQLYAYAICDVSTIGAKRLGVFPCRFGGAELHACHTAELNAAGVRVEEGLEI